MSDCKVVGTDIDDICPRGCICEGTRGYKCTNVQKRWKILLDGTYCPSNTTSITNCPVGSYCPDAQTKLPCPKGYFCPHKTKIQEIKCSLCEEGATEFAPDLYGYIVFSILYGVIIGLNTIKYFWQLKKKTTKHVQELNDRRIHSQKNFRVLKQERQRMERLGPKLRDVFERVGLDWIDDHSENVDNLANLFSAIDTSRDGIVQYDELNIALKLRENQLIEFVKSMNQRACVPPDTPHIDEDVFMHHFFETIDQVSNFDPTPEDCEELFQHIALQQGGASMETIIIQDLYSNEKMFFLSDRQLREIVKGLQKVAQISAEEEDTYLENGNLDSFNTSLATSYISRVAGRPRRNSSAMMRGIKRRNLLVDTKLGTINEATFIKQYPFVLHHVIQGGFSANLPQGVDISFQDLSLHVIVDGKSTPVLDKVTGRLQRKTMTALIGGSGAGKTSLLNALCGRAFYGEVSGTVMINGHETTIDKHMDVVGFVPQDDIVYAELTVRENFMFAGKFRLPHSTSLHQIQDLADEVLSNLGLTRVADSIVGDMSRRGVSGGEKKRVSIGLELMANPSILFLDEPTSGLDASSAMLVMKGLKDLVEKKGVTVCSVIHQPRKNIFELFNSIILLGVGGRMVYHGPVDKAEEYFTNLGFMMPRGESIADWLIDISSGQIASSTGLRASIFTEENSNTDNAAQNRTKLYKNWIKYFEGLDEIERGKYVVSTPFDLPTLRKNQSFGAQLVNHIKRNLIVQKRNIPTKSIDTIIIAIGVIAICLMSGKLKLTNDFNPNWRNEFALLTTKNELLLLQNTEEITRGLYAHVLSDFLILEHAQKLGVIIPTLLAIAATKVMTEKRHELFREAGSGYNLNAYYLALNITSTIENTIKIAFISLPAIWLRCTATSEMCMLLSFMMMAWVCTSWSLFFPIFIPPKNIVLVIGIFIVFFSLLFSGTLAPTTFETIYDSKVSAFIAGMFSASRHFVETMLVSELRTLPPQSGFTLSEEFDSVVSVPNAFNVMMWAQHDMPEVSRQTSDGWYQQILPPFLVGLSVRLLGALLLHVCNRPEQARPSFMTELKRNISYRIEIFVLFCCWLLFFILSVWQINN